MTLSCVSKAQESIPISLVREYIVHEENVADFVVGAKYMVYVVRDGDNFSVRTPVRGGKTYVLFLKNDGTSKTYFFEVVDDKLSNIKEKRGQLVSGTLRGRSNFSDRKDSFPYSLGLNTRIKTTENSSFTFNLEHQNNYTQTQTELTGWEYVYKQYFLSWSTFVEPTPSVPFYNANRFRGYTAGYYTSDQHYAFWTANRYNNQTEDPSFQARGILIRDYFDKFSYKFNLNNYKDEYIPLASVSYVYKNWLNTVSASFLNQQYLFGYFGNYSFTNEGDEFTLRTITSNYSVAPNGSYGLNYTNNNFYQNYGAGLLFSNQDYVGDSLSSDIDFLAGIFTAGLNFDESKVNDNITDRYNLLLGYGSLERLTISGNINYSVNYLNSMTSEDFSYAPRLSFFFLGNKTEGYSVRNEYTASTSKGYAGNNQDRTRNTIGIYRNGVGYYYGLYVGGSDYTSGTQSVNSKIGGAEFTYYLKNNTSARIRGEGVFNELGSYQSLVELQLKTVYKKDLNLYARINYSDKYDGRNNISQSAIVGNLGFVWNFGFLQGNVYSNIEEKTKSISGQVFNDINLNGIKDFNEPVLEGIDLSLVKVGDNNSKTDSSGSFSFSGFSPNETIPLKVGSEKYAAGKTFALNMKDSYKLSIPMYEFREKKVYIHDQDKNLLLSPELIRFSCENNEFSLEREVYSDHILYKFPKDQTVACEPEISDFAGKSVIVRDVRTDKSGDLSVDIEYLPKMISFEFVEKIKPFYLNNKLISPKSKQVLETVSQFEGLLDIKLDKNCKITPEMTKIPYNKIKNQNFYKILCF